MAKEKNFQKKAAFKALEGEELNSLYLNPNKDMMYGPVRCIQTLLEVQRAAVEDKCPVCNKKGLKVYQSGTVMAYLVCGDWPTCKTHLPHPREAEDSKGRKIFRVDLIRQQKVGEGKDRRTEDVKYSFNPFGKNGDKLPAVFYLAWGLITGNIPKDIFDPKDRGSRTDGRLDQLENDMKELHIFLTRDDITKVGQALIQLIKDRGEDFLGVIDIPKDFDWDKNKYRATRSWPYHPDPTPTESIPVSVTSAAVEAKEAEEVKWEDDHLGLRHVNDLFGKADINKVKKAIDLARSCRHSSAVFLITGYAWVMSNISASEGNYEALNDAKYLFPEFNEKEAYSVYFRFAQQGFTAHSIAAMILEKEHGGITEEDLTEIFNKGVQEYYPETKEIFWSISLFKGVLKKLRGYDMPDRDVQEFFLRRIKGEGFFPEEPEPEPVVSTSTPEPEPEPESKPEPESEPEPAE